MGGCSCLPALPAPQLASHGAPASEILLLLNKPSSLNKANTASGRQASTEEIKKAATSRGLKIQDKQLQLSLDTNGGNYSSWDVPCEVMNIRCAGGCTRTPTGLLAMMSWNGMSARRGGAKMTSHLSCVLHAPPLSLSRPMVVKALTDMSTELTLCGRKSVGRNNETHQGVTSQSKRQLPAIMVLCALDTCLQGRYHSITASVMGLP
ncbi:uncharacterized protein LOC133363303 [Rhineura floridana]|uniref:uncharacterized protein LOC133363303 n=1 Tax=Rhineura floridana TaxID=261503 RepID=UPI002AC88497|nr:uncharacterized protein LOC133363303 [Rhineura floridana]